MSSRPNEAARKRLVGRIATRKFCGIRHNDRKQRSWRGDLARLAVDAKLLMMMDILKTSRFRFGYGMLWQGQIFALTVLLLWGCARESSLETGPAKDQSLASNPEIADACLIATTGADRHGVPLPKEALKAIRADLKDKKVDCPKSQ